MNKKTEIINIIGGGVIGLSLGWRLLRQGACVRIFDQGEAGKSGASWVSAGMLSPRTEAGYGEADLLAFGIASLSSYPEFLKDLKEDSGESISLNPEGTMIIALDRDDLEMLEMFFDFRSKLELPVKWLDGRQARAEEPLLSPNTLAAVLIPDDLRVDPKALLPALKSAFVKRGGLLEENARVEEITIDENRVAGMKTETKSFDSNRAVLAAGCWSPLIKGIPENLLPAVRPVKGQILTLKGPVSLRLTHVLRAPDAYLVPRENGKLIVGATSEEMGYDTSATAGSLLDLLDGAIEAIPSIREYVVEEIEVGLRPGSRDNFPILGETRIRGLYYATGHSRHGILLAPATAHEMAKLILSGDDSGIRAFSPERFLERACA